MAGITASGLGSGLDVESIISGLMRLEQRPLSVLHQRQDDVKARISAIGTLKSAVSDFKTAMADLKKVSAFEVYTATSQDEEIFTATANSSAVAGSYTIDTSQVSHQLAQAHKIQTLDFTDDTSSVGNTGTLRFEFAAKSPAESFDIAIDSNNNTLQGIRDAINNATDNIGITATIINVDSGSRLIVTSDETGLESEMSISDVSGTLSATLGFSNVADAQNAIFSIDGNTVTSQSNTIKDAIEGVTIKLESLGTASKTLRIDNDTDTVKERVQEFVDAYNNLTSTFDTLQAGRLQGDNIMLSVERQLRNIFNTTPNNLNTPLKYLSEIGITTNELGLLVVSDSELEDALNLDYDGVAELLADDDQGYIYRLENFADDLLDIEGMLTTRTDVLNDQVKGFDQRIADTEYRLGLIEARYRKQFTSLDSLLSGLNNTSSFLAQQLSSLPTARPPQS